MTKLKKTKAHRVILDVLRRPAHGLNRADILCIAEEMYSGGYTRLCAALADLVKAGEVTQTNETVYRIAAKGEE